ncbi:E3 ubiquitin-protein ligase TRIM9-like isoform X3 [Dreissena polymorpha]|uniref:E3 ubiquitin-protein ligase TRIM9-like isoform X3 n=1 Tax=Dreissena polymorpha TaxID=45954 RepID=UPI0022646756|nr:E3 ubiquitin-protein ligase TRIM9-like isoform X3 [Dreissena polymorpha]
MEGELKCPVCSKYYVKPVLLSCSHNLCSGCAHSLQDLADKFLPQNDENNSDHGDYPDVDKLSIVSETDSGVVCNSRPSSYISTPSIHNLFLSSTHLANGCVYGIKCPVCKKVTYLGETGFQSLPRNRVLDIIVEKFSDSSDKIENVILKCELCDTDKPRDATVVCEQCEVHYCESCRERCHPSRGPLAKHNLIDPEKGRTLLRAKLKNKDQKCYEHTEEVLSLYCLTCKIPICIMCQQDGPHINHDSQAIGAMCKTHKTELSQTLQSLSEKAKTETEFIQKLKAMTERIPPNCVDFEALVVAQCDSLIDAIQQRKQELLDFVSAERDMKVKILKDQAHACTSHLQKTTSLLYFCIEVLKESDPASFLQISSSLLNRVSLVDQHFFKEIGLIPRVSPEFELTLDNSSVLHAIQTMNFFQMKAPGQPAILPEECSAENNSVTIAWQPYPGSVVDAYTLELDDGNGGDFRVVYIGPEMMCTVDGLHFNSIYNARVKCQNHAGESDYSDLVSLQTAEAGLYSQCMLENHLLSDTRRLLEHLRGVV